MGFQSKTYSLSDEVVAAIEVARSQGLTPNKFLRQLLKIDENQTTGKGTVRDHVRQERLKVTPLGTRGPRPKGDKTR